jgi:stage IV sporulation protein FB
MPGWVGFLISILIHEAFHLFAGRFIFGQRLRFFLTPTGLRAAWDNTQPDKLTQCLIFAAGPLGNIIIAFVFSLMPEYNDIFGSLVKANFFIGIFNLIPLYPMDGGNILLVFLYKYVGSGRSYSIMKKIGQVAKIFLFAFGIYIMVVYKNPSLLMAVIFLPGTKSIKRSVNRLNLDALIRRRERILKKRTYRIRHVLVLENVTLGEAILLLDYDQFHIIHIADKDLNLNKEISEKQLIDAIIAKGAATTLQKAFT